MAEGGGVRDIESRLKKRSSDMAGMDLDSMIKGEKYQKIDAAKRFKKPEESKFQ